MAEADIDGLVKLLARLPGLGPRSARRAVLHLMARKDALMVPLAEAMAATAEAIGPCSICGNLDTTDPCRICADPNRDPSALCVVADVSDLWALERSQGFHGQYHVLGGTLSALAGIGPDDLTTPALVQRASADTVTEVILALNATVDGQTTAHVVADRLAGCNVKISRLAHGVPVGGELDYLDDGTLTAALRARRPV